jgi:NADP-dependent 3-hydroxy acid dehydrogenase YdfG
MKRFPDHPERRPAVVAGASSGIGAATAMALAAAGHPVALGARRVDHLEQVAAAIREAGGEAVCRALDVTDDASVRAFADGVTRHLGDIEIVVASAGLVRPGAIAEQPSAAFARELDLNITGAQRLVHAFVPDMVDRTRGDIVFVSSDVAGRARPMMGAYTASKWGLEGMAHALQMELEGTGVRASIVRPGPTLSEMGMDWDGEGVVRVLEAWGRFGLARHDHFMPASAVADAITAIVSAPRGVHLNVVEVTPEAPIASGESHE